MEKVTLYGIPASHSVEAAVLMLDLKGIPYRRINIVPGLSRKIIPKLGFPGDRVPSIKVDGRKVSGTIDVARELDRIKPDPPLFPSDPAERAKVEQAEVWGDEFQQVPRTIIWLVLQRAPTSDSQSYLYGARLGLPAWVLARTSAPLAAKARKLNHSDEPTVKKLITELPAQLDKIDAWIAEGVLDGPQLNVADFQIGTSLRLLMSLEDFRRPIESRPAGDLAKRVQTKAPGHTRAVLPQEWLEPLRQPVAG